MGRSESVSRAHVHSPSLAIENIQTWSLTFQSIKRGWPAQMFREESRILFIAAMRCHNVCKVFGTTVKDSKLCIVMRLYKESLQGVMERSTGGCIPIADIQVNFDLEAPNPRNLDANPT